MENPLYSSVVLVFLSMQNRLGDFSVGLGKSFLRACISLGCGRSAGLKDGGKIANFLPPSLKRQAYPGWASQGKPAVFLLWLGQHFASKSILGCALRYWPFSVCSSFRGSSVAWVWPPLSDGAVTVGDWKRDNATFRMQSPFVKIYPSDYEMATEPTV
jgi:hypothetical protein